MTCTRFPLARLAGKNRQQQGYALLMVVFMATALLILAMMVAPNVLTYGKREKEKEMIWRGKQYVRGIKLHYRKLGRFPTSLDDLTKPKIGSIRFMRKPYKDPMNKEDGSWRIIYVVPAASGMGTAGITGAPVSADTGGAPAGSAIPMGDTPVIIGGNIIGVGSKINMSSVKIYEKATNYRLFEFIWDPSKDVNLPGILPAGVQNPLQNTPGTQVPNPASPQQNPQQPQQPQNPQQQQ